MPDARRDDLGTGRAGIMRRDADRRGLGIVGLPVIIGEQTPGLRRHIGKIGSSRSLRLGVHRDLAQVRRVRAVLDAIGDEAHARRQDFAGIGGRPPG
jgi:hypothetical protein